jgi:TrmH family RNA methyltransferase
VADIIRITSMSNRIIKEARSLGNKKGRKISQAILLEGYRLVRDALDSGAEIRYFIISDNFFQKEELFLSQIPNIKKVQVPDELFSRISETESPQGVLAVAEKPVYDKKYIISSIKRAIALENIQDPGNLGTIIRSADACGFDAVFLSKDSVDPYNNKVIRSTMGSLFHIPVIVVENFIETLQKLKSNNILIAAAHVRDAVPCWQADMSGKLAVIIGNEGNGISDEVLDIADITVMIPMSGKAESLNASAAASILIYECMRQMERNKIC